MKKIILGCVLMFGSLQAGCLLENNEIKIYKHHKIYENIICTEGTKWVLYSDQEAGPKQIFKGQSTIPCECPRKKDKRVKK